MPSGRRPNSGFGLEAFGDPEVHQANHSVRIAEDVRGLEIAVDDTGLVNRLEARCELHRCVESFRPWKAALDPQELAKVDAFEDSMTMKSRPSRPRRTRIRTRSCAVRYGRVGPRCGTPSHRSHDSPKPARRTLIATNSSSSRIVRLVDYPHAAFAQ